MLKKPHLNLDRFTREGLIDFANLAQKNPDKGKSVARKVSNRVLQNLIAYASFKALELGLESPEEKQQAHERAEEEFMQLPLRCRWRVCDEDVNYAHLRNLDAMDNDQLVMIGRGPAPKVKEFWGQYLPHIKVGVTGEYDVMQEIRSMALNIVAHREGKGGDVYPSFMERVDNAHRNMPPWVQWRHHFGGYSTVQGKCLPPQEVSAYRYDPHSEAFDPHRS